MPLLGTTSAPANVYHDIDTFLRPRPRTRGTLLSVAREIPRDQLVRNGVDRTLAGVEFTPWPASARTREPANCDTVYDKSTIREVDDTVAQPSFLMWDRIECSTGGLELDWLVDAALQGLDDYVTVALALELEDPNSGGFGLRGNATYTPTVGSATAEPIAVAIARLEEYLAGSKWAGAMGVIHLTPALLTLAAAAEVIMWDPSAGSMGAYVTPTGHCVVGDAGHLGSAAPQGQSGAGTDEAWIYATSDVWYALGSTSPLSITQAGTPDEAVRYMGRNKNRPLLERAGLVVFDPNVLGATLADMDP